MTSRCSPTSSRATSRERRRRPRRAAPRARTAVSGGGMALHCPECGFVNPEGANYCQKCGAYLGRSEGGSDEPTMMTYKVDETGEMQPVDLDEEVEQAGAALVIRSGGGRAGESFTIDED